MPDKRVMVIIGGDMRGLHRALRSSRSELRGFGAEIKRTALSIAGLAGVGFTLEKAVGAAFEEFSAGERAMAQVRSAIKATGGVAGVTASHVRGLAKDLSEMSGVNRNVIRSGEALLLTFTRIRNQAGRGNGIFDRAAQVALDISARKGEEYASVIGKVGKALDNPIKATRALRGLNVQLTKAQENLIKKLVATGNTLGAQKVILDQLTGRYRGAARAAGSTLAGQWNKLRNTALELGASIAGMLVPTIRHYLVQANKWLSNAHNQQRVLQTVRSTVRQLTGAIRTVAGITRTWFGRARALVGALGGLKNVIIGLIGLKVAGWALGASAAMFRLAAGEDAAAASATRLSVALKGLGALTSVAGGIATAAAAVAGYGIYSGNFSPSAKRAGKFIKIAEADKKAGKGPGDTMWDLYRGGALSASDAAKFEQTRYYKARTAAIVRDREGRARAAAKAQAQQVALYGQYRTRDARPGGGGGGDGGGIDTGLGLGPEDAGVGGGRKKGRKGRSPGDLARQRQMAILAVGPGGVNSVSQLKSKLTMVKDLVKGTVFDTAAVEREFGAIRKVLTGQLGKVGPEVRKKIQTMLQQLLDKVAQDADGFNLTLAEHRRRQLDRRRARSRGAGQAQIHYHATVNAVQNEPVDRALERTYYRMKYAAV